MVLESFQEEEIIDGIQGEEFSDHGVVASLYIETSSLGDSLASAVIVEKVTMIPTMQILLESA